MTTLQRVVRELSKSTGDSVVVVGGDGRVLATAGTDEPPVGSISRTADLTSAEHGHPVTGHRTISGGDALAVSVPVLSSRGTIGTLRMSSSLAVVDDAVTRNWLILGGLRA